MRSRHRRATGAAMAALLGDCLARRPLRGIPSDLEALLPLLIQGGVAPLVWGHCRDTLPPQSAAALALRHQHFTAAHDSLLAEGELSHLARAFDASGVPYLLGKGRVVAQAYASMTDRPFADFDVYVPASHYDAARAVPRHGQWRHAIDLHRGAAYLDDTSFDCLLADAATVVINDVPVRTFSEEHHLRLVCLHALAEGLMSPRWLCDVAVLVLARSPRFDWRRFEAGEAWRTRWAYVAIDLARQIFALGDDSR